MRSLLHFLFSVKRIGIFAAFKNSEKRFKSYDLKAQYQAALAV